MTSIESMGIGPNGLQMNWAESRKSIRNDGKEDDPTNRDNAILSLLPTKGLPRTPTAHLLSKSFCICRAFSS